MLNMDRFGIPMNKESSTVPEKLFDWRGYGVLSWVKFEIDGGLLP
jgi:hypothetical protein